MRTALSVALFAALSAACSTPNNTPTPDASAQDSAMESSVTEDGAAATDAAGSPDASTSEDAAARDPLIVARPYQTRIPNNARAMGPLPLVVLLHGYGANAIAQESYFALREQVSMRNFFLAIPDGTRDMSGRQFWNATDACCDFGRTNVDDVAYLRALIGDMKARFEIDANKVYVIGHSNGGFMTLRLACELSDQIAAVMSLAGAGYAEATRCAPSRPVHVLQVHGDADATVNFMGAPSLIAGFGAYPGAEQTVGDWAARNGCSPTRSSAGEALDLDTGLAGAETTREAHTGCRAGGSAELWRIRGGSHIPSFTTAWAPSVIDWLYAHARTM